MNELIEIPKENALTLFTKQNGLDPLLQKIADEVKSFIPDLSTAKSRAEIASLAAKIAKSKTYIDGEGKKLVDDLKEKPKLVDAERKRVREFLDNLKEEVRRPLTEWEDAEKLRVYNIRARITRMSTIPETEDSATLRTYLDRLVEVVIDDSFAEFKGEAAIAKHDFYNIAEKAYRSALLKEKERFELESLRKEAAEREQKKRDDEMVRLAEEAAIKKAAEAYQKQIDAAKLADEKSRLAILEASQTAINEANARAEKSRLDALEAQERERRSKESEEKRVQEATKAEAARIAHETAEKQAAETKRIAESGRKEDVLKRIASAIAEHIKETPREDIASVLVEAIQIDAIPHLTINY